MFQKINSALTRFFKKNNNKKQLKEKDEWILTANKEKQIYSVFEFENLLERCEIIYKESKLHLTYYYRKDDWAGRGVELNKVDNYFFKLNEDNFIILRSSFPTRFRSINGEATKLWLLETNLEQVKKFAHQYVLNDIICNTKIKNIESILEKTSILKEIYFFIGNESKHFIKQAITILIQNLRKNKNEEEFEKDFLLLVEQFELFLKEILK